MFDFNDIDTSPNTLSNSAILELTKEHIPPYIDYETNPDTCEIVFKDNNAFNMAVKDWHYIKYETLPGLKLSIKYTNGTFYYFDDLTTHISKSFYARYKFWVDFDIDEFCYYIRYILPTITHMLDKPLIGFPMPEMHDMHLFYPNKIFGIMGKNFFRFTEEFKNFRFMAKITADDLMKILDIAEEVYGPDVRLDPMFARLLLGSFIKFNNDAGFPFTDEDSIRLEDAIADKCFCYSDKELYQRKKCGTLPWIRCNYSVKNIRELIKLI